MEACSRAALVCFFVGCSPLQDGSCDEDTTGIHVVIEAGRTMVNNGKWLCDPIFREHSLDNVV